MDFKQFFDIIVIGGGPGGYHFANLVAKNNFSVALFEEKGLGGTCLNEGCIPSKSLLKSAKIADEISNSTEYGILVENILINQLEIIERKNRLINKLALGVRGSLRKNKVKLFFSHADILQQDGNTFFVSCENEIYACSKLVIATGSEVLFPNIKGVEEGLKSGVVLSSREILNLTEIPKKLTVIGGGVIGLEMASYFNAVGSKVTVVEAADKICGNMDVECSNILLKNLSNRGINFKLNAFATEICESGVTIKVADNFEFIASDKILMAVGRKPNVSNFGLEKLNLEYTAKGIAVNEFMQTSLENVFAIGDVNGKVMLAHTAYAEAEVCADYLINKVTHLNYDNIPSVIYTLPESSWVGINEKTANEQGINFAVKKLSMAYSGRSVVEEPSLDGLCKMLIDIDKNTIIGATIIGGYASEIIAVISNLIALEVSIDKILRLIFPHPTIGEIIKDTLNT